VEIADAQWIDAQPAADGITRPRPQDRGTCNEQDPAACPATNEDEQGGVE
jgi:hypothetical protein